MSKLYPDLMLTGMVAGVILFLMKLREGFSLIEVMIAVTIISIIGAASLASYINSRKSARDAKRRGDMVALQQAYEQYFAVNKSYADCTTMASGFIQSQFPTDPQGTYILNCNTDDYCLCALLERSGSGNAMDSNCSFGAGDYYCAQSQQ